MASAKRRSPIPCLARRSVAAKIGVVARPFEYGLIQAMYELFKIGRKWRKLPTAIKVAILSLVRPGG
jgi:hypothetical protein